MQSFWGRPSRLGRRRFKTLWFERLMALLALLNLGLVAFDASYIPRRDFYLQHIPQFTLWYGERFKGIEPHRLTAAYLAAVQNLEVQLALTGVPSAEVNQRLEELQALSITLIDENPFGAVGQSGTLEQIKNRMRSHMGVDSAKQAFSLFWSQNYLQQTGWNSAMHFFYTEIEPLIARNYYRRINEVGGFVDRFWHLDLWFMGIFGLEFWLRTLYLSRRFRTSWLDAIIWRSYDIPLFMPFWRWLRLVPVVIRLNQTQIITLAPITRRLVRLIISSVVVELTELVVLRIINQLQNWIQRGEAARWLLQTEHYIDLNGVNETAVISKHLITVLVYHVLPQMRTEIDALLHHSMTQILSRSPLLGGLQHLPGMKEVSHQLTQQLVADISEHSYRTVAAALEDETGSELMQQLLDKLGQVFRREVQQSQALGEIESLTVALLDEVKVSYVRRVKAEDVERLKLMRQRFYEVKQSQGQ